MFTHQSQRFTVRIRSLCLAVAWVAIATGLARYPEVWQALDATNIGYPAAILLYVWFWVGLALVAYRVRTAPGRFVGLGGVFLSMIVFPSVLPRTHVGSIPDYNDFFTRFMFLGCITFFAAGALAWVIEGDLALRDQA
jgi:hypothetical protein